MQRFYYSGGAKTHGINIRGAKRRYNFFNAVFVLTALAVICAGCKSKPVRDAPPLPRASFSFDSLEASDPSMIDIDFILSVNNLRPEAAELTIENWNTKLNGVETTDGITLLPGRPAFIPPAAENKRESVEIPVRVKLELAALDEGFLKDDMDLAAELALSFAYDSGDIVRISTSGKTVFPVIREPGFSITAIAVLKDELINTRFRVNLKVDNPNPFPVELSSFEYELYGDGRFWADGGEKNVLVIPGRSSKEARLFLTMNFINMKRPLLDQIIRLEDVRYRFNGEVVVSTGVDYLPSFVSPFDLSGFSRVYEN